MIILGVILLVAHPLSDRRGGILAAAGSRAGHVAGSAGTSAGMCHER